MTKRPPVANHLTDEQYRCLMRTYANHNSSMGFEQRVKYTFSHIVKVEVNKREGCLDVHYEDGEWWHYTPQGTWY